MMLITRDVIELYMSGWKWEWKENEKKKGKIIYIYIRFVHVSNRYDATSYDIWQVFLHKNIDRSVLRIGDQTHPLNK